MRLCLLWLQADSISENDSKPLKSTKLTQQPWPGTLPLQISATAQLLASASTAMNLQAIEASFKAKGPWQKSLTGILETLEALGHARCGKKGESSGWQMNQNTESGSVRTGQLGLLRHPSAALRLC